MYARMKIAQITYLFRILLYACEEIERKLDTISLAFIINL